MNEKHFDTLSAFFDGEPVDPSLLAESLAQPGAAGLLAEFAALRSQAVADDERPDVDWVEAVRDTLAPRRRVGLFRRVLVPAAMAATLVLTAGIVGFRLGSDASFSATRYNSQRRTAGQMSESRAAQSVIPGKPGSNSASSQTASPVRQPGGPPTASLRLRFSTWQDLSTAEEFQRR